MFPAFPAFLPLQLELKEPYNRLIEDMPPYSDISFTTLQIWWNLSEQLSVSLLNRNLVIHYHLPFDPDNSGLGLVGRVEIDKSIQEIFYYQKQSRTKVRLVHVPEFVVDEIKDPGVLDIQVEHDYSEYLLDSSALAELQGHDYQRIRKRIRRFVRDVGEERLEVGSLDLSLTEAQDQLFNSIAEWESSNAQDNDPEHTEHLALKKTLSHASSLDIRNLAVYIDKKLRGVILYHQPLGKDYLVLHHLKASYENPGISDYLHHEVAKRAAKSNVSTLNIEMDLGVENLKKHKMLLRPAGFFRKYTVQPRRNR